MHLASIVLAAQRRTGTQEKMWQKTEASEEKRFVWKTQSMRMTELNVKLKTRTNNNVKNKSNSESH